MSLPQLRTLAEIQGALGVPVQVGGSFARGEADAVSDLDLTFAPPEGWEFRSLGGGLVAAQEVPLGPRTLIHEVWRDGTVVDLLPGPPLPGSRDAREWTEPLAPSFAPALVETGVLADFWLHTHKHAKPLARGLEAMAVLGLAHDRTFLMRLWSLAGGGGDPGPSLGGIHAMSPLVRRVATPARLTLLGMTARDRGEIVAAVQAMRDEVSGLSLPGAERVERIVRAAPVD